MTDDTPAWISYVEAARLLDVAPSTVTNLVRQGQLTHRSVSRNLPSLGRSSVLRLARQREEERERIERARLERAARTRPPDDGQVWLSVSTTAALLGVTPTRVTQMIRTERLPATRKGQRWWIRRQHAEILAAARAATRRRSSS